MIWVDFDRCTGLDLFKPFPKRSGFGLPGADRGAGSFKGGANEYVRLNDSGGSNGLCSTALGLIL